MTMMIDIATLAPEMWQAMDFGVIGRAKDSGLWKQSLWNMRDFSPRRDRRVDDRSYGGGPGMVIGPESVHNLIEHVKKQRETVPYIVELDPSGFMLSSDVCQDLAKKPNLLLLCGRYEGIDARIKDFHVDLSISTGPYVLSGGDLAAMCLVDAVCRFLPGTLGNETSLMAESYDRGLLDHPHYTRPKSHITGTVDDALLSGDPKKIDAHRQMMALGRTWQYQPDLLKNIPLSDKDIALLLEYIKNHFNNL